MYVQWCFLSTAKTIVKLKEIAYDNDVILNKSTDEFAITEINQ